MERLSDPSGMMAHATRRDMGLRTPKRNRGCCFEVFSHCCLCLKSDVGRDRLLVTRARERQEADRASREYACHEDLMMSKVEQTLITCFKNQPAKTCEMLIAIR